MYLAHVGELGTLWLMSVVVGSPVIDFVVDVVNGWGDAVRHNPPGPAGPLYPSRVALEERS